MLVYLDFSFIGGGLTCDTVHLAGTLPSVQEIYAFWLHLISQKYTLHCTFLFGSSSEQIRMVVDGFVLIWTRVKRFVV